MSEKQITTVDSMIKNVFTIECTDIILREFMIEDLEELYALTLQPEITDFLPDWKATKEQRGEWLEKYHIKENKRFLEAVPDIKDNLLCLGIILKKTNKFIGWCCTGLKDELPSPSREIAYAISKDYRGRGYTTQAGRGVIKYLFRETNVEDLNAIALTYNTPSNKVIQKCGFKFINIININNQDFYHYKLNKSEWQKLLLN